VADGVENGLTLFTVCREEGSRMFRAAKMAAEGMEAKSGSHTVVQDFIEDGEQGRVVTGGPSPMLKASLFSFLTWQWVQSLITTGQKKPLEVGFLPIGSILEANVILHDHN
jgi:hypothetical protein